MAENLYSKYRPLVFSEVFGQEKIVKELEQRCKENTIPFASLMDGFTGSGKTTLAKIVAKNLLCQHKDKLGNSCNKCEHCVGVISEQPTNYYYEYNASNIGIEEMRDIDNLAGMYGLSTAKAKVIVIDELQELSNNQKAMKNILKVLERPMEDVYFILLTMDSSKVPTAIKNRTVQYKLKPHNFEDISKYLYSICQKENIEIDTSEKADTLIAIAQNSYGSMRTAVSYLERCIYSEIWNKDTLIEELNLISNENLIDVINKILTGDITAVNTKIDKELLDRIKYILNIVYKHKSGLNLNTYEIGYAKGIKSCSIEVIENTIATYQDLIKFPYVNNEIIEFTTISLINRNKKSNKLNETIEPVTEEPRRRRLP